MHRGTTTAYVTMARVGDVHRKVLPWYAPYGSTQLSTQRSKGGGHAASSTATADPKKTVDCTEKARLLFADEEWQPK